MNYLDVRPATRVNAAAVCATLGKRDQMHFLISDATTTATSQMFYDVLRWTCAASLSRDEVGKIIAKLHAEGGGAPALRALESTPASSEDESEREARGVRLRLPRQVVEQALISSAADENEANDIAISKAKEELQESPNNDIDSADDDRPIIRRRAPQGLGQAEEPQPYDTPETTIPTDVVLGLWRVQSPCGNGRASPSRTGRSANTSPFRSCARTSCVMTKAFLTGATVASRSR